MKDHRNRSETDSQSPRSKMQITSNYKHTMYIHAGKTGQKGGGGGGEGGD